MTTEDLDTILLKEFSSGGTEEGRKVQDAVETLTESNALFAAFCEAIAVKTEHTTRSITSTVALAAGIMIGIFLQRMSNEKEKEKKCLSKMIN